jgi:predicted amidohydrolase YtcJ
MIDQILYKARFYTQDPAQPYAEALALRGGEIVAVGGEAEILALAGPKTRLHDLGGAWAMPAWTDAHIHWELTAKARQAVDLSPLESLAAAQAKLKARMPLLGAGEWLVGMGWAQDSWGDHGRQFPDKSHLDSLTGPRPAYLMAKSAHAAWVNSAALALAGITAQTPDPEGGRIGRGPDGEPDGILYEAPAMALVRQHMPRTSPERLADWMADLQTEAWSYGIGAIHDFDNPSCMVALQLLREQGRLGLRVVKQINDPFIEHAHELGLRAHFGDEWLRIGALKLFADGALGPRTAAMLAPYEGEPDNTGVWVTAPAQMQALISRASRLGLPSTVHAIGDAAVRAVLDIFAAVRAEEAAAGIAPAARRHRIEHVQVIHPDDRARLGQLGLIASMQAIHAASDWQMADRWWGERSRWGYAWRTQLESGARLAFGSDAPIDHFDPRQGLFAALTRRDMRGEPRGGWYPQEAISLTEALAAYTSGPAYAAGLEHRAGRLAEGYLADVVVLGRDPFQIPAEDLLSLPIVGTMVGGTWRWGAFDS